LAGCILSGKDKLSH